MKRLILPVLLATHAGILPREPSFIEIVATAIPKAFINTPASTSIGTVIGGCAGYYLSSDSDKTPGIASLSGALAGAGLAVALQALYTYKTAAASKSFDKNLDKTFLSGLIWAAIGACGLGARTHFTHNLISENA